MGRLAKNTEIKTGSTGIRIPVGTTADRPSTPVTGQLRFNTDTGRFEFYQSGWKDVTSRGPLAITKDQFTGDGSTTAYTLSTTPNDEKGVQVFVGNVHQNPTAHYTISSTTLTFNSAPNLGQTIEVYQGFDSTDR
jgi:hypothetical protein